MPDKNTVIAQTQKWLSSVIIGYSLCPFAKVEFENDTIHYVVIKTADLARQLEAIAAECERLDVHSNIETSLLIFPSVLADFEDYLDLLDMANQGLKTQGYEGAYQLASFHPDYRFEGAALDDPSNYTNRSPYPMVHILREASVEAALENYPDPENIPQRNIKRTRELGLSVMKSLLAGCLE